MKELIYFSFSLFWLTLYSQPNLRWIFKIVRFDAATSLLV